VTVPVIGVIEPGAHSAVAAAKGKPIAVIGTEATVQSGAYARAIERLDSSLQVIERACPLFVPLAEEGWADSEVAFSVAQHYLSDLAEVDARTLVLGCTHYPILQKVIQRALGSDVTMIDSGEATAYKVENLLQHEDLSREASVREEIERQVCDDLDHFYVTDAARRFAKVAERFLGAAPSVLEAVEVWGHDELRTH
jgi:glutamate racemase